MEKLHIILNPASSSGRGLRTWEKLRPLFEREEIPYELHLSAGENADSGEYTIEKICARLTAPERLTAGQAQEVSLCLIGGDGTLNAAVNGIVDFARTKVGVIQAGSGNDFARGFGLSMDAEETVRRIARGRVLRRCDVGEVHPGGMPARRFAVSAGIGFDAAVCREVDTSGLKKRLNRLHMGKLAYIGIACRQIFSCPAVRMRIRMEMGRDVKVIRCREALFAAVMNTPYEGGGFMFAPDAAADDGVLNLCAADHIPRLSFFRIFPHAYRGSHLKFKGVVSGKGESIEIRTDRPLWVHTDGEVLGTADRLRISIRRKALRMIC